MKFYNYLNEKTYSISADVDYIYNKAFKKVLSDFKKDGKKTIEYLIQERTGITIPSSELKSKQCKKANEIKPIFIFCGSLKIGNQYRPVHHDITLSINRNAIEFFHKFSDQYDNIEDIIKLLNRDDQRKSILNVFKETDVKGSIYHELSHGLNDVFHNQNIEKRLQKANEFKDVSILQKHGSALFTDYEIDAQVHAIKQIKRNYGKKWDSLTGLDLIEIKPAFSVIFKTLKNRPKSVQEEYRKLLIKRLNREKLLGKFMQTSFYKAVEEV